MRAYFMARQAFIDYKEKRRRKEKEGRKGQESHCSIAMYMEKI